MNIIFWMFATIAFIFATYYLISLGEESKEVSFYCCVLGLVLTVIGIITALAVYGTDQTINIILLKEHKLWARFIPIGYGCFISGIVSILYWHIRKLIKLKTE